MAINYPQRYDDDFLNTIKTVIDHVNVHGKTMQDLVVDGQLTPEQFSELIRTINGLIKSGHVSLDDLSPDVLEAINSGDGASFEILSIPRDRSVTPEKTTFIDVSSNILDTSTLEDGFSISGSTGEKISSSSNSVSDFLPVRNTENEKLSMIGVTQVARYDENKEYINVHYPGNESYLFTPSPTTHYIRVTVNIDKQDIAQINEGEELLPYEPYYKEVKEELLPDKTDGRNIVNKSISLEKLDFSKLSTNLYNQSTVLRDAFVDFDGNVQSSTQNNLSDFISIDPNTIYTLAGAHTTVFYDRNKNFINRPTNTGTFTTPSNAYYVRLVMGNSSFSSAQLNLGSELLPYEPYGSWISKEAFEPALSDELPYYFAPEEIVGYYKAPSKEYEKPTTSNDFHDLCNQLADEHQEYITSTLKGTDESGQYEIYQYHLKPLNVKSDELSQILPKLVIVGGLHGEEKSSIYSLYHLTEQLCNNWKNDPLLEYLRWNIEIVMIPLANPYGFNHQTLENRWGRQNVNGVDLNRNFSEGWRLRTIGESTYGGTEPFSEVETQYVKEMIDENKDAIYFCDYHTNGSSGDDYETLLWHTINNDGELYNKDVDIASTYFIGKMTREFIKDYDLPEDQGNYGWISYSGSQGLARDYGNLVIGASSTFECFKKFPTETERRTDLNIKACTEYVINWLLTVVKQFKDNN